MAPGQNKIEAMVNWSAPTSLKQLRGFLGLTGFYRCFINDYASNAYGLTELLKEDAFTSDDKAQQAFDTLKLAMTKAHDIPLWDLTKLCDI